MTRKSRQQPSRRANPKPQQAGKPPATGNRQVAEQLRKILRTHYASKYRVR